MMAKSKVTSQTNPLKKKNDNTFQYYAMKIKLSYSMGAMSGSYWKMSFLGWKGSNMLLEKSSGQVQISLMLLD